MVSQVDTLVQRTWLADIKVPCTASGVGTECPDTPIVYGGDGSMPLYVCGVCNGTGLVYLFSDSVRVPCPRVRGYVMGHLHAEKSSDCYHCQGRGWTPSIDGWQEQCQYIKLEKIGDKYWNCRVALDKYHGPYGCVITSEHFISADAAFFTALERVGESIVAQQQGA